MTQINYPYFIRKLRDRNEFSQANNNYLDQLERILEQIYGFSTTDLVVGIDEASSNENQIAQLFGMIAGLTVAVADLASDTQGQLIPIDFRSLTVDSDYTAIDRDFLNVKRGAIITLPEYPPINSVIIIRNGDGSKVGFSGNGKTINGSESGVIYQKGTALVMHYFIDSDEWLVR